jgi:hypothetical protein
VFLALSSESIFLQLLPPEPPRMIEFNEKAAKKEIKKVVFCY